MRCWRWLRTLAFASLALSLASVGWSGAAEASGSGGSAPGVTSNTINVASLAAASGALSTGFVDLIYGVKAYFDMVNAHGGVDGRKIHWIKVADDQGSPTTDEIQARNLVQQDHVFAIVGVGTPFFESGPYLGSTGTPTFGYLVEGGWNKYHNLFGAYGSVLDYNTNGGALTYVVHQLHDTSVAVMAYGFVATSKDACQAAVSGMKHNGVNVSYQDLNMSYLEDPTPDVQQISAHHADLVFTCVDGPENLKIAEALHQYGVNAKLVWLNGYSRSVASDNAAVMNGDLFQLQHVPFEAVKYFPGKYPAMAQYISTMNKYEPAWTYDDISFQGWVNAELFVDGLKKVGKNLTQQKLISAINNITNFTADGLTGNVNWKTGHTISTGPYCSAWVEVTPSGTYEPAFVQKGDQTQICFNATSPKLLSLPSGLEPNS
jgi:branched-chain amino acid transport system substrate-binding protein